VDAMNEMPCDEAVSFRAISYENIVVAFLILPTGIIISLVILTFEKIMI
jgi:hypothetical protein